MGSGCKINFLRKRSLRLAAYEKRKMLLAPNKPPRGPKEFFVAPGILVKGPLSLADVAADLESGADDPTKFRFRFTECHEASFSSGRTIKIRTMTDTHNLGTTTVMKSDSNRTPPTILYPAICIEAKTKSSEEALDEEQKKILFVATAKLLRNNGFNRFISGPNDVEKMARILTNSSLNFKYTTLEKATGSFDSANKLGQGGFGAVFKTLVWPDRSRRTRDTSVLPLQGPCYMAPDYVVHGQLTEKVDVYSFGVLVLEIVTGKQIRKSEMSDYLVTEAWKHFLSVELEEIFDPNLNWKNHRECIIIKKKRVRVVQIGLLCTEEIASLRPSMSKVLQMLKNKNEVLPLPSNPLFLNDKVMELRHGSNSTSYAYTSHATISPNSSYCR